MLQPTVQPTYCLTIHNVQTLTLRHNVHGCLEGMFALGQLYVLWSRVTDPNLFHGVGLPPSDRLGDVARAWAATGLDVHACFAAAVKVSGDWAYTASPAGVDPCHNVRARLIPLHQEERRAADVVRALLSWIDRADVASQAKTRETSIPETWRFCYLSGR